MEQVRKISVLSEWLHLGGEAVASEGHGTADAVGGDRNQRVFVLHLGPKQLDGLGWLEPGLRSLDAGHLRISESGAKSADVLS